MSDNLEVGITWSFWPLEFSRIGRIWIVTVFCFGVAGIGWDMTLCFTRKD